MILKFCDVTYQNTDIYTWSKSWSDFVILSQNAPAFCDNITEKRTRK